MSQLENEPRILFIRDRLRSAFSKLPEPKFEKAFNTEDNL